MSALIHGCYHGSGQRRTDLRTDELVLAPEDLFQVALLHAKRGDLLRAEQYLIASRDEGYDEASIAYWLVRVCVAAGRYHSALGHAADYLRTDPLNWQLRLVVASIHEALGDLDGAEAQLEWIVRTQPDTPLPHYRLATLYLRRSSERHRAWSHLEMYLALAPSGPHAPEVETLRHEYRGPESGLHAEPLTPIDVDSEGSP